MRPPLPHCHSDPLLILTWSLRPTVFLTWSLGPTYFFFFNGHSDLHISFLTWSLRPTYFFFDMVTQTYNILFDMVTKTYKYLFDMVTQTYKFLFWHGHSDIQISFLTWSLRPTNFFFDMVIQTYKFLFWHGHSDPGLFTIKMQSFFESTISFIIFNIANNYNCNYCYIFSYIKQYM